MNLKDESIAISTELLFLEEMYIRDLKRIAVKYDVSFLDLVATVKEVLPERFKDILEGKQ